MLKNIIGSRNRGNQLLWGVLHISLSCLTVSGSHEVICAGLAFIDGPVLLASMSYREKSFDLCTDLTNRWFLHSSGKNKSSPSQLSEAPLLSGCSEGAQLCTDSVLGGFVIFLLLKEGERWSIRLVTLGQLYEVGDLLDSVHLINDGFKIAASAAFLTRAWHAGTICASTFLAFLAAQVRVHGASGRWGYQMLGPRTETNIVGLGWFVVWLCLFYHRCNHGREGTVIIFFYARLVVRVRKAEGTFTGIHRWQIDWVLCCWFWCWNRWGSRNSD